MNNEALSALVQLLWLARNLRTRGFELEAKSIEANADILRQKLNIDADHLGAGYASTTN